MNFLVAYAIWTLPSKIPFTGDSGLRSLGLQCRYFTGFTYQSIRKPGDLRRVIPRATRKISPLCNDLLNRCQPKRPLSSIVIVRAFLASNR